MRRLITTSYKETALLLENEDFPEIMAAPLPKNENLYNINKDLDRIPFISHTKNRNLFYDRCRLAADQEGFSFNQGDFMGSAFPTFFYGNIFVTNQLVNDQAFKESHPNLIEDASASKRTFCFGYFNDHGELCGINVVYNKYNPAQWLLCILKNASAPHQERRIHTFLNNMNVNPKLKHEKSSVSEFLTCLESYSIAQMLDPLINRNNHTINETFAELLLPASKHVDPSECPAPKSILGLYNRKQIEDRKQTVILKDPKTQNETRYQINLDTPLSYDDIINRTQKRLEILEKYLTDQGTAVKYSPLIVYPETPICPFSKDNMDNSLSNFLKNAVFKGEATNGYFTYIPLNYGSHWNVLMLFILCVKHEDEPVTYKIASADYFYSYPNEAPEILGKKSLLAQELQRADPGFNGKIFCFQHFHSPNMNDSAVLAIEEIVFYIKHLLGIEKKLTPLLFQENDIATFRAHHTKLLEANKENAEDDTPRFH